MGRSCRTVIPFAPHHVTQRGNNRRDGFGSDADRRPYLKLLAEETARYYVRVLGGCLMTNHVHLILIPEEGAAMAAALARAHSRYTLAFNKQREKTGHLRQSRFHPCVLDGRHLMRALRYVELNPVRAGLVWSALEWPWSSARAHARGLGDPLMDWDWPDWFRGWD